MPKDHITEGAGDHLYLLHPPGSPTAPPWWPEADMEDWLSHNLTQENWDTKGKLCELLEYHCLHIIPEAKFPGMRQCCRCWSLK